jgi:hypothetical protein
VEEVMNGKSMSCVRARVRSLLAAALAVSLAGCGGQSEFELEGESVTPDVEQLQEAITGGWTTLSLRNGWTTAAGSNTPAVGIVDGIVTFRGALNGQNATSNVPFCLTAPTFTQFRPSDVGLLTVRAALANEATGSLLLDVPLIPQLPPDLHYCMQVFEHGAASQPGPNARARTSLEGVSYDRTFSDSIELASPAVSPYPQRGSDGNAHPNGVGVYGKKVNNFVRLQTVIVDPVLPSPGLFSLPNNQGMIPGNPVYIPVTVCPLSGPLAARLVVQTNGQVIYEGPGQPAGCGVSLDGASYSMASSAGTSPIALSNGWVPHSNRAVRVRQVGGVVRLEGGVKNGTTTTIGTLPAGMRPTSTIYVVANAMLVATPSTLRINTSGVISIVSPHLVVATSGISLDGVSFAL